MPDSRTLTYKLVGKAEGKEDLRLMADELRGIQAVLQTLKKDASGASALQGAAAAAREQARVARSEADAVAAAARQYTGEIKAQRAAQEALTASVRATGVAAQLTGSAVEVASLGEAFGAAVQLFSASNDKLSTQLQGIEGALGKSLARSDEPFEHIRVFHQMERRECIVCLSLLHL